MKKHNFYLILVLSFFYTGLSAQEYKKTAEQQFMHYTNLIIQKDFRAASDFIMEDLYTLVPKEQMIKTMEEIFNMPELEYHIDSAKVLQVGDSQTISNTHFLKLQYVNILRMKFDMGVDSTEADSSFNKNELLTLTLQSKFGEPNVTYNPATGFYRIYSVKDVIAKSKDLKSWKFIVLEDDKMPFLKKIIPKELLE